MKARVFKPGTRKRKSRIGRGFSIWELREAGISITQAKKIGIYVDNRRKTLHKENVDILKRIIEEAKV